MLGLFPTAAPPRRITVLISLSVTEVCQSAKDKSRGFGSNARPPRPSPLPVAPWHCAHRAEKSFLASFVEPVIEPVLVGAGDKLLPPVDPVDSGLVPRLWFTPPFPQAMTRTGTTPIKRLRIKCCIAMSEFHNAAHSCAHSSNHIATSEFLDLARISRSPRLETRSICRIFDS